MTASYIFVYAAIARPCINLFTAPSICPRVLPHKARTLTRLPGSALPQQYRRDYEGTGGAADTRDAHGVGLTTHVEQGAIDRAGH